jgi:hypothetical protein
LRIKIKMKTNRQAKAPNPVSPKRKLPFSITLGNIKLTTAATMEKIAPTTDEHLDEEEE